MPRHIAIIMDGNGRWARARGLPRIMGHRAGARAVRRITTLCAKMGTVQQLTLYAFSAENWSRPAEEVGFLMRLLVQYLRGERKRIMKNNIRLKMIGDARRLAAEVRAEMRETLAASAGNTGMTLCLAINYGARAEIVRAARSLARKAARGALDPAAIDEDVFARHLYTRGMREPDLLIRTADERRLSNFLLWQCSYTEFHFTETLWPDFDDNDLNDAIEDFAGRERKFGALEAKRK